MRKPKPQRPLAECPVCGSMFKRLSQNTKVCSVECRFVMYANQQTQDECWNWSGPVVDDGYGRLFIEQNYENGKRISIAAHRYSYEKHHDVVIPETMCVMHKCDNPACVNPYHLALGTWAENNTDRSRKGRSAARVYSDEDKAKYSEMNRGSKNNAAKITEDDVRFIRYTNHGMTTRQLATQFGISKGAIESVIRRTTWKHV